MKLQNFSVIFIAIILPIALVLSIYTGNLISVSNKQSSYDSILLNSTYDAVRAYQMNTLQNNYDAETNSKVRDINASINTFFNSLSLGLASSGLSKQELTDYVPAILYTLYDGYYVYGVYDNIVNTDGGITYNESGAVDKKQYGLKPYIYYSCEYADKYGNYDLIVNYTLDNYITVTGNYFDTSINKKVNIAESGYYVNYKNMDVPTSSTGPATFDNKIITLYKNEENEVKITPEKLGEYLITVDETSEDGSYHYNLITDNGKAKYFNYIMYNGVKYYLDPDHINADGTPIQATKNGNINTSFNATYDNIPIFFLDKDTRIYISQSTFNEIKSFLGVNEDSRIYSGECFKDVNAYYYYYRADKFSRSVENALKLIDLGTDETIDENGHVSRVIASNLNDINNAKNVIRTETYHTNYTNELGVQTHEKTTYSNSHVFELDEENDPELESSSFNLHRMDVIISSIESSLVSTIANFNNYTGGGFVYTMPVISETEWNEICNNISILSFMQGLTIGNYKYYSSYSLMTNTKVKDYISKDAIYVQNTDENGEYHNPKCLDYSKQNPTSVIGYTNVDYERQDCIWIGHDNNVYYYYLQGEQGAYECIVGQNSNQYTTDEIIEGKVIEGSKDPVNSEIRRAYLTALARGRGNSYKTYGFLNEQLQIKTAMSQNEAFYTVHYLYQDYNYETNEPILNNYHELDYTYSSTATIGTLLTRLNYNKTPNIGYKYLGDNQIKVFDYNTDQLVNLNDSNNRLQNNTKTDLYLYFDVDMTITNPIYYDVEYYVWSDETARYYLTETQRRGEIKWINAKTQLDVEIPKEYNGSALVYTDPAEYANEGQKIATGSLIKAYYSSSSEFVNKTFRVRYHTANGEGTMEDSVFKFFERNSLSPNKFTYSGNQFKGWSLRENGDIVYYDTEIISFVNENNLTKDEEENYYLDLYAVWETGTYQVKYNPNGATSGTMENSVHKFNEASKLSKNQYSKDYTITLNVGINNTNFYKNNFDNWGKTTVTYDEANNEYRMIVPKDVEKYSGLYYKGEDAVIESGKVVTISYEVYSDKEITLGLKVQNENVGYDKSNPNIRKDGGAETIIDPVVVEANKWTTIYFSYKNNNENPIYDYSILAVEQADENTNVIIKNPRLEKTNLKTVHTEETITATINSKFLNWADDDNNIYEDEKEIINLTDEIGKIVNMKAQWEKVQIYLPEVNNEGLTFKGWKDQTGKDVDPSKPLDVDKNITLDAIFEDDIAPETSIKVLDTTSNTITVEVSAEDYGMGMSNLIQYNYYIKERTDNNYTEFNGGTEPTYKFEKLKQNTEYDIKVVVISDKAGNNGEAEIVAKTNNFTGTIYVDQISWMPGEISSETESEEENSDESGKAMVKFETKDLSDYTYYLECKKEDDEEWTRGNTVFNVENTKTVYARLTDGLNFSESTSVKIEDLIEPTVEAQDITTITVSHNTININITAIDNETGLGSKPTYTYSYKKVDEEEYTTNESNENDISIENLEQDTVYDIIIEATDFAGNIGRKEMQIKTSYIYDLEFNAGLSGVSGSMQKWSCYKDVTYTIPNCAYKKGGYKFLYWKIGDTIYNPGDKITNLSQHGEKITLTAIWKIQFVNNPAMVKTGGGGEVSVSGSTINFSFHNTGVCSATGYARSSSAFNLSEYSKVRITLSYEEGNYGGPIITRQSVVVGIGGQTTSFDTGGTSRRTVEFNVSNINSSAYITLQSYCWFSCRYEYPDLGSWITVERIEFE